MGLFSKKKPPAPLKYASKDPPVADKPNAVPAVKARAAPRSKDPISQGAKDKDLAEWMGYLFGSKVRLERITDIDDEAIVPFSVMKMQNRLHTLTGGAGDPDLMHEWMQDFMEMSISIRRQGRREMQETISSGIKAAQDDDPEAFLKGKI